MNGNSKCQEKILQQVKFPDDNFAVDYYQSALSVINRFHQEKIELRHVDTYIAKFLDNAESYDQNTPSGRFNYNRWKNNADALSNVLSHPRLVRGYQFSRYRPHRDLIFREGVSISAKPDFLLSKQDKLMVVKYHLASEGLNTRGARLICQCMMWSSSSSFTNIDISRCAVIDPVSGKTHRFNAESTLLVDEIDATCRQISAWWPHIEEKDSRQRAQ
ncbi:hypothetical protein KDL44_14780 [bacterium]|nr:hypothetical protein [bacterium]